VAGAVSARLAPFDGLRALAALSILAYHVAFVLGYLEGDLGPWLAHLNVGVPIFFVLSGFLLYRPFAAARLGRGDAPEVRAYAIRRVLRIMPAYWVALPVVALVLGTRATPEMWLFAQIYSAETFTQGIGQAWTLCIEVVFYAFLPLWAWAQARTAPGRELALLAGLFALGVAWKVAAAEDLTALGWFPAYLDHFALGMALAVASVVGWRPPAPAALFALGVAGLVALGFAGGAPGDGPVQQALIAHTVKGVVAVLLVAPALAAGSAVAHGLGSEPLRLVGVISYGVYLWHLMVVEQLADWSVQDAVGLPGFVVVALGASLALGALSWRLVERPCIALARRLGERRAPILEHAAP